MESLDWSYAISTLLIRFVGIFVVLGILQVVMQITGRIFAYVDAKQKKTSSKPPEVAPEELTHEEAAAVAMALYVHKRKT